MLSRFAISARVLHQKFLHKIVKKNFHKYPNTDSLSKCVHQRICDTTHTPNSASTSMQSSLQMTSLQSSRDLVIPSNSDFQLKRISIFHIGMGHNLNTYKSKFQSHMDTLFAYMCCGIFLSGVVVCMIFT